MVISKRLKKLALMVKHGHFQTQAISANQCKIKSPQCLLLSCGVVRMLRNMVTAKMATTTPSEMVTGIL